MTEFRVLTEAEADAMVKQRDKWRAIGEAALQAPVFIPVNGTDVPHLQVMATSGLRKHWPAKTFTVRQSADKSGIVIRKRKTQ